METSPLIAVINLQVKFGNRIILDGINLTLQQGKVVTIIGPNGAGKSTLIISILGLVKPTSGKIYIKPGVRIGYMPQRLAIESLMPISVDRFLQLSLRKLATNLGSNNNYTTILTELKIEHLRDSPLQMVSVGEMQRILLARALLNTPQILILDEPMQGVDITGQTELYKFITNVTNRYNCGILMVSHDLHLVMASTDEVICLNKHICCSGRPEAVSSHPEFLDLFGTQISAQLAFYAHQHNHKHNLNGEVVND